MATSRPNDEMMEALSKITPEEWYHASQKWMATYCEMQNKKFERNRKAWDDLFEAMNKKYSIETK